MSQTPGLFARLYAWMMAFCARPSAERWLAAFSFSESSFFPIPPDVMLIPMVLRQPPRWLRLATITTLSSVVGGVVGYYLGAWLIEHLLPWIQRMGWQGKYDTAVALYAQYGAWALIIKGLTPFPYKIFTISAGAAQMPLLPFIVGSLVGRAMRFYLVAGLMRWAGPAMGQKWLRYVEWLGWGLVLLVVAAALWLLWR